MISKLKRWWKTRRSESIPEQLYTKEDVIKFAEEYGAIKYNDGKRDGLAIARDQATKSLTEILRHQNRQS